MKAMRGRRTSPVPQPSVGLTHFAIPLGISGIAGVWTASETTVGASEWVADILWIVAAVFWAFLRLFYVLQRVRTPRTFTVELQHPIVRPFAASMPVIGLLLLTDFGR